MATPSNPLCVLMSLQSKPVFMCVIVCSCVPPPSPSLSSSEVFQVDEVEAWQLMPPQDEQLGAPAGHKTGALAVHL